MKYFLTGSSNENAAEDVAAGGAAYTLVAALSLPALGVASLALEPVAPGTAGAATVLAVEAVGDEQSADVTLENELVRLTIAAATRRLAAVTDLTAGLTVPVTHGYYYYTSSEGTEEGPDADQKSGAYIFRPVSSTPAALGAERPSLEVVRGRLLQEVRQRFGAGVRQTYRLRGPAVEVEWTVGPLDVADRKGREVVARFDSALASAGAVFTDSNGLEMLRRQRDYRPSWNVTLAEPVAGNYYPINSAIYVEDAAARLTVLVDRAQGGASMADGSIELMVHRRTLCDDARGVDEPINEPGLDGQGLVVRGTHLLLVGQPAAAGAVQRRMELLSMHQPLPLLAELPEDAAAAAAAVSYSPLTAELPANVHLLTLTPLLDGQVLLRLLHVYGAGEDAALSAPATVNLAGLFKATPVLSAVELSLTANQLRSRVSRLQWNAAAPAPAPAARPPFDLAASADVELQPMEIRTFLVRFGDPAAAAAAAGPHLRGTAPASAAPAHELLLL